MKPSITNVSQRGSVSPLNRHRLLTNYPVFFLLLGLCILSACKKNSLPGAGGNTLSKTVVTLSGNSSFVSVDSFVYDGQQRLLQIINSVSNPRGGFTVTLQYDASGHVASWTESSSGLGKFVRYELSYDGSGHVVKARAVPLLSNFEISDYSFAYNSAGQVAADTVFAGHLADSTGSGIVNYDVFTYDKNGNVATDQQYASTNSNLIGAPFKVTATYSYQYDTHVNPYFHVGIPFYASLGFGPLLLSPNNVVVTTTTDPNAISPSRYSFAYYSNDRPRVQTTAVNGGSGMETQTTAYYYQ